MHICKIICVCRARVHVNKNKSIDIDIDIDIYIYIYIHMVMYVHSSNCVSCNYMHSIDLLFQRFSLQLWDLAGAHLLSVPANPRMLVTEYLK